MPDDPPQVKQGRICAGALLVTEIGRYVMQRRDDFPWIDFPDHWGFFGGAIEPGETPERAVRRELVEEIGYVAPSATPFTELDLILPFAVPRRERISVFLVPITEAALPGLVVAEGAGLGIFTAAALAAEPNVAPWDLAAVLMHARRATLFRPKSPRPPDASSTDARYTDAF